MDKYVVDAMMANIGQEVDHGVVFHLIVCGGASTHAF